MVSPNNNNQITYIIFFSLLVLVGIFLAPEKVAKITKNHGFLGEKIVGKLKEGIVKDRDEVILRRFGTVEKEASGY